MNEGDAVGKSVREKCGVGGVEYISVGGVWLGAGQVELPES